MLKTMPRLHSLTASLQRGGIPYIGSDGAKECGQTWFHASGEQYRDSTINSNFFEQTAKYYNTVSNVYNKEHLGQIDIAGSLYQNARTIAGVNQAMTAVNEGMLPWEAFNGIFAGVGRPFAVKNRPTQKASPEVGGSGIKTVENISTTIDSLLKLGGNYLGTIVKGAIPNIRTVTVTEFNALQSELLTGAKQTGTYAGVVKAYGMNCLVAVELV